MKRLLPAICLFIFAFSQTSPAEQLLDDVLDIMNPEFSQGIMVQTIVTTKGDTRELEYDVYTGFSGEMSIMRYRNPSRLKNNAILTTDFSDNIWNYNHRTKRVRKLASHAKKQKFEGSDFTYEDMGTGDVWKTNYEPLIGERKNISSTPCTALILSAVSDDVSYSEMIIWVRDEDHFPLKIDYFDDKGNHQKSLLLDDIREVEGILTAFTMIMENHLDQTQTSMVYKEVTYNVKYEREFFSERNLKKIK